MAGVPNWPERITAPKEAKQLYRWMAKAQLAKAFTECHVYDGANINGVPYVSWENKSTNLPKIVCSFMGLQYSRKTCKTPNCMNPFHYIQTGNLNDSLLPVERELKPVPPPPEVSLGDYLETVRYYIEENDLTDPDFSQLRPIIPAEDISDEILQKVVNELKRI